MLSILYLYSKSAESAQSKILHCTAKKFPQKEQQLLQ